MHPERRRAHCFASQDATRRVIHLQNGMLLHLHPRPEAANKESNDKHFILATAKARRRIHQDGMTHSQGSVFTAKSQAAQFLF